MILSVVLPYYRNPGMLSRQYEIWASEWPTYLKDEIEIVIVDDGSPESAADVPRPVGLPYIRIFRVLEDRPWHQHAARNIGAHEAKGEWLLMTDMDHVIPAGTLERCVDVTALHASHAPGLEVYTFQRVDAPAGQWRADDFDDFKVTRRADGSSKPHVNSFMLRRAFYWQVGGYDESYCGLYGTDGRFRKRLYKAGVRSQLNWPLIRVSRDVICDASTVGLQRKEGREPGAKKRVDREKPARIVTLQHPWERVA